MTEREVLEIVPPFGSEEVRHMLSNIERQQSFEALHGTYLEVAYHSILESKGMIYDGQLKISGRVATRGKDYEDDDEVHFAYRILRELDGVRWAVNNNQPESAAKHGVMLGRLTSTAEIKFAWEPIALHGQKFRNGAKLPRRDALALKIYAALNELGLKASARDIFDWLVRNKDDKVHDFDEDNDTIYWTDFGGKEKATKYKSFLNRVSCRRKILRDLERSRR